MNPKEMAGNFRDGAIAMGMAMGRSVRSPAVEVSLSHSPNVFCSCKSPPTRIHLPQGDEASCLECGQRYRYEGLDLPT